MPQIEQNGCRDERACRHHGHSRLRWSGARGFVGHHYSKNFSLPLRKYDDSARTNELVAIVQLLGWTWETPQILTDLALLIRGWTRIIQVKSTSGTEDATLWEIAKWSSSQYYPDYFKVTNAKVHATKEYRCKKKVLELKSWRDGNFDSSPDTFISLHRLANAFCDGKLFGEKEKHLAKKTSNINEENNVEKKQQ